VSVPLKGMSFPRCFELYLSPCILAAMRWATLLYCALSAMIVYFFSGTREWIQLILDWNLWNCKPKYIFLPFKMLKCFSQVFFTAKRNQHRKY
jgi:hypothetical protein